MKKINFLALLLCLVLIGIILKDRSYSPEDVNKDGRVDSLDLLIVQKKIINDMENERDDKNGL
jgi:hypothetical protein